MLNNHTLIAMVSGLLLQYNTSSNMITCVCENIYMCLFSGGRIMTYSAASHKKFMQIFYFSFMEPSSLNVASEHLHFVFYIY